MPMSIVDERSQNFPKDIRHGVVRACAPDAVDSHAAILRLATHFTSSGREGGEVGS